MRGLKIAFALFLTFLSASATPILTSPASQDPSTFLSYLLNSAHGVTATEKGVSQEVSLLEGALKDVQDGKINPVTTVEEAMSSLSSVHNKHNTGLLGTAIELITKGLAPQNILDIVASLADQSLNSVHNLNPIEPNNPIFPKSSSSDAPYSKREEKLRSAIHIPAGFQYGANGKRPVLLVPGTGDPAGTNYHFSYAKLLSETDFADPIWVNIPDNSLDDVQVNSEYVAYAMNYISDITNTKIGVLGWSQGTINIQWALKYWPSTRDSVEDFIALSGDFHGTLLEEICTVPSPLCAPAGRQQGRDSEFIKTLRSNDGDSAYVPTTSIYSGLDEIIAPQTDPNASGSLNDVRGVGVTNMQIQLACPGLAAGSFYFHITVTVNPVAWALVVDALTHSGPGDLSRVHLDTVCNQYLPPGLVLTDLLGSEVALTILSFVDTFSFGYTGPGKEPPIKDYARISS